LAKAYGSKYMEVSAILNHKVDDLLVSALKQIRLCNGGGGRPQRHSATDHSKDHATGYTGDHGPSAAGDDDFATDNNNCSTTTSTATMTTTTCSRSPGLLSRLIRAASPRRT